MLCTSQYRPPWIAWMFLETMMREWNGCNAIGAGCVLARARRCATRRVFPFVSCLRELDRHSCLLIENSLTCFVYCSNRGLGCSWVASRAGSTRTIFSKRRARCLVAFVSQAPADRVLDRERIDQDDACAIACANSDSLRSFRHRTSVAGRCSRLRNSFVPSLTSS